MMQKLKWLVASVGIFTITASAHAGTNERADLLRCELHEQHGSLEVNGSMSTRPIAALIADAKDLSDVISVKYKGKEYLLAGGSIANLDLSKTSVGLVRTGDRFERMVYVDAANMIAKMQNGTYLGERIQSPKVQMPSGEYLFISCSGRSERQQLIRNANNIETLYRQTFGISAN